MSKRFSNPADSVKCSRNVFKWLRFFFTMSKRKHPQGPFNHVLAHDKVLEQLHNYAGKNSLTWLGHACFFIQLDGKNILTDPFLMDYASPINGLGPQRYVPPALSIEELSPIDIIIVSHNHYDHLDLRTLKKLKNKANIQVVCPLKVGKYFKRLGYKNIAELDWYESWRDENLSVCALPAIHFCQRGLFDRNQCFWASFGIYGSSRLFFAGDTGYHSVFKQIGEQYGPFDVALVPIGAYEPRELMQFAHVDPEEAFQLAQDVRASEAIAMHWGTIVLTEEPIDEPPKRFNGTCMRIGESRVIGEYER